MGEAGFVSMPLAMGMAGGLMLLLPLRMVVGALMVLGWKAKPEGRVLEEGWWDRDWRACLPTMFLSMAVRGETQREEGLVGLSGLVRVPEDEMEPALEVVGN